MKIPFGIHKGKEVQELTDMEVVQLMATHGEYIRGGYFQQFIKELDDRANEIVFRKTGVQLATAEYVDTGYLPPEEISPYDVLRTKVRDYSVELGLR